MKQQKLGSQKQRKVEGKLIAKGLGLQNWHEQMYTTGNSYHYFLIVTYTQGIG